MSLKTDAKNIYIFSPHVRYGSKDNDWSKFMEKDFTIVMRVRVYPEEMIEDLESTISSETEEFLTRPYGTL